MTVDVSQKGDYEIPVVSEWQGNVLLVTLNRPTASNALNVSALQLLSKIWTEAEDERCRAVVITGAGRNFCAGADLKAASTSPDAMDLRIAFHPPLLAMRALAKPVIAAINGAAAGGGLGLALAADIRIMSKTSRLCPAWVDIGLVPDLGASWFATELIGHARAFEWFATGWAMSAEMSLALGLTSIVTAEEDLLASALEMAHKLARQPGSAVALTKRLLHMANHNTLAEQLEAEISSQRIARSDPDRTNQVADRMAIYSTRSRS